MTIVCMGLGSYMKTLLQKAPFTYQYTETVYITLLQIEVSIRRTGYVLPFTAGEALVVGLWVSISRDGHLSR